MPIFRRWKPDEDEVLCRLYGDTRYSREEIEQALGRSWYSIVERTQKLKLHRPVPGEWSEAEITLLKQVFCDYNYSHSDIERIFNRSWNAISQRARLIGLYRPYTKEERALLLSRKMANSWSEEQIQSLNELFPDYSVSKPEIEQRLGRSWSAIQTKASDMGLKRIIPRKCEVNTRYFTSIETEEQAYFLGLLAADGSVLKKGVIEIELQHRDRELVERLRDVIAPGVPLKEKKGVRLAFSAVEMAADLAQFGVIPRKSYNFAWPHALPETFALPFLLGYFDGDGHFHQGSPGAWRWEILGTYDFLYAVKARLEYYVGIQLREPTQAKPKVSPHLYRLQASGKRVIAIDRVLNRSGLGLPRKHLPPNYPF